MHTSGPEIKRTSLALPAEDHRKLTEIARRNNRDFSKQVRHLIKQHIAEVESRDEEPEEIGA